MARPLTPSLDGLRDGRLAAPRKEVRIKAPLDLGEHHEPEPDLAAVTSRSDAWLNAHPSAADTLLVIEVADASLADDLDRKARLDQQAGITNGLVVDGRDPMAYFLPRDQNDLPFLAQLRKPVEALVAELRAQG